MLLLACICELKLLYHKIVINKVFLGKILLKGVITLKKLILILMIIGGINWGLIGFFNYNLVSGIFGAQLAVVSRIIYAVVGLSALYGITFLFQDERRHA